MFAAAASSNAIPSAVFRGHGLPAHEALERWREQVAGNYELERPDPVEFATHGIEQRGYMFGGMALLHRSCGGHRARRSDRLVRSSQIDHYCLRQSLTPTGTWRFRDDDGRGATVTANEPVFADMAQPMELDFSAGENVAVFVPRDALDALLPRKLDLHGARPPGVCSTLLAHHLRSVVTRVSSMHISEAPGVMSATLHLMAASLSPSADSLALARPQIERGLLRRVSEFVEANLHDPDLSAEKLCQAFHISRSTLYRLVEPMGGVGAFVRERRLARIHALLSQPAGRQYLGRIADDFGFRSASHFSRAFRTHFGYSPRDVQGMAAHRVEHPAGATGSVFGDWLLRLRS